MKKYVLVIVFMLASVAIYSQNGEQSILKDDKFKEFCKASIDFYSSSAYISFKKENNELIEKLPEKFGAELYVDFDKWINSNLSLTKFKTVDEAKELYTKVSKTNKKVREKDSELTDLMFKFIAKYGLDDFKTVYDKEVIPKYAKIWQANGLTF